MRHDAEPLRIGGGGGTQSAEAVQEPAQRVQLKVRRGTALIRDLRSDSVLSNTNSVNSAEYILGGSQTMRNSAAHYAEQVPLNNGAPT